MIQLIIINSLISRRSHRNVYGDDSIVSDPDKFAKLSATTIYQGRTSRTLVHLLMRVYSPDDTAHNFVAWFSGGFYSEFPIASIPREE